MKAPSKSLVWLWTLVVISIAGSIISYLPYYNSISDVITSGSTDSRTLVRIGDVMTTVAQFIFIMKVLLRVYHENLAHPSPTILSAYAGVIVLFELTSDFLDVSPLLVVGASVVLLVVMVLAALQYLKYQPTRSIGVWTFIQVALLFLSVFLLGDIKNLHGIALHLVILVLLVPAVILPYKYLRFLKS
ncbi:MAG: hypothetical protein J1E99_01895 [Muribaculaceae bacterium]|nr:hypothetical protein [Muribaculaceae bacterium]